MLMSQENVFKFTVALHPSFPDSCNVRRIPDQGFNYTDDDDDLLEIAKVHVSPSRRIKDKNENTIKECFNLIRHIYRQLSCGFSREIRMGNGRNAKSTRSTGKKQQRFPARAGSLYSSLCNVGF